MISKSRKSSPIQHFGNLLQERDSGDDDNDDDDDDDGVVTTKSCLVETDPVNPVMVAIKLSLWIILLVTTVVVLVTSYKFLEDWLPMRPGP